MAYKETRLNFEPSSSALVVDLDLPSTVNGGRNRRRANGSVDRSNAQAESDDLRARTCASASSTYHRKHHAYPKSFLWRLLENDTVLSIRAIDVLRPEKVADANLVLNFRFAHPIRPGGIALTDPQDHDALTVFVLDSSNQLHTLFLRPDSFRKRSFVETGLGDACKVHHPNALKVRHPYRLYAINHDQLIVTLSDGGLIRFDRNKSHNTIQVPWKETFYNAKRWVHGLANFFGKAIELETTAALTAVQTNLGNTNASFLFTVCLDHRLRIWNLNSGQILETMDLLNAERSPQETGKWQLDPSQTNLIRIVGDIEGERLCVTYSPVGSGEFKFWRLRSDDADALDVDDMFPSLHLVPKPPSGADVWTLADFVVDQELDGGLHSNIRIWALWKNNMAYRVQHLEFTVAHGDPETDGIYDAWENQWATVYSDTSISTAQASGSTDPIDVTEKWLRIILAPGKFPRASIEAALNAYERAIGKSNGSSRNNRCISESICSAIASTNSLKRTSTGEMDNEQFRVGSESQWRRFYRILIELDKPRGEALALAYEPNARMPWVVCADRISAIRDCSALETVYHYPGPRDPLSNLISTGRSFLECFSDGMLQICNSVLRSELFEQTTKTDYERIQFFSDKAGFWRQISDEDCAQVTDALGENFNKVSTALYEGLIERCNQPSEKDASYPLTEFGQKVTLKSTEDLVELQWNVCFSQLILLVHMEFEFDQPEDALHNRVDIGSVYRSLVDSLRRLELIRWLSSNQVSIPLSKSDRSNSTTLDSSMTAKRPSDEYSLVTALEANVAHLLGFESIESTQSSIAEVAADLCATDSNIELHPHYIQCALLVQERPDLAIGLSPLCDETPFSTYIQGRVHLALKDLTTAASYFRKAAYGMSVPMNKPEDRHSSGLLNNMEWNLLYAGLPRYYAHIVSLYERQKAYSYVVEFSRLSLQFIYDRTPDADTVRTEMQSRLFSGAAATSQFELAHATLVAMGSGGKGGDRALQHSCLQKLVHAMCDGLHAAELASLPFPGPLQAAVDDILARRCRETVDVVTGSPPYHQILYAWRIRRNDYRGAAAVLLDRIQKLRLQGEGDQPFLLAGDGSDGDDNGSGHGGGGVGVGVGVGVDVLDTPVTRQYLMLINVLSCIDPKQAWIAIEAAPANGAAATKRKVVTLADVRKEYQDELDRIAAIQNNQFGFAAGDEMEIL
ncbi:hypothetical protein SLS62_004324 [Diatrype stigma]|uniref:Nuclear pore complex protein Nup160 n=1 Tax=Diatrype stigma TaxID=117547 RepID=A0AAN9UTK5_9PEZI